MSATSATRLAAHKRGNDAPRRARIASSRARTARRGFAHEQDENGEQDEQGDNDEQDDKPGENDERGEHELQFWVKMSAMQATRVHMLSALASSTVELKEMLAERRCA